MDLFDPIDQLQNQFFQFCFAAVARRAYGARQTQTLDIIHDEQQLVLGLLDVLNGHHVGVMQNGVLVEQGTAEQILTAPQHDYTKSLLNSVPRID